MSSIAKSISLSVLSLLILIGCASVQQREDTLRTKYPDWSAEVVKQVAERNVEPGMTMDMVKEALGRKGDSQSGPGMGEEVWIYYVEIARGEGAYWAPSYYVYFKNDKVVRTVGEKVIFPW